MESLLKLEELVAAVKGNAIGNKNECFFSSVQTDSRLVQKNTLFVPLIGEFQNGHKYIPQAIEKGASVVFVAEEDYEMNKKDWEENLKKYSTVTFILVKNTLHALQDAAEAYVNKVCQNMIKISITGSCGKTTTKEMMVSVCKQHFGEAGVAYTKGNFNSETGLPLSVFKIRGDEKVGIFEMGMNRVDEIGEISKVFKSQYGIITNVGTAHIGILGSRENIAAEKRKSLRYITKGGAAFIPASDDFADYCGEIVTANGGKVVKFGAEVSEKESCVKFIKDDGLFGTVFSVKGLEVHLPISGMYNYQNALGVIDCALEIGISADEIKKGLELMGSVAGRMEVRKAEVLDKGITKEITLINDCYNANPDSMTKSIELVSQLENVNNKILILGDMKELGASAEEEHRKIGLLIEKSDVDGVFFVGQDMKNAFDVVSEKSGMKWYPEKSEAAFKAIYSEIYENLENDDVVFFKGSHSMELEKIFDKFYEGGKK